MYLIAFADWGTSLSGTHRVVATTHRHCLERLSMPSLNIHGCSPSSYSSPLENDTRGSSATEVPHGQSRDPSQPPGIHVTGRRRPPSLQFRVSERNPDSLPVSSEITYGGCVGSKSFRSDASGEIAHVEASSHQPTDFKLTVPYVSQEGDPTGCWYACAQMIGQHFEAGPRLGVPQRYNSQTGQHHGVTADSIKQLIKNENLLSVNLPRSGVFLHDELEYLLKRRGPIMFGWVSAPGQGPRHMSVITGISRERNAVIFHDPNPRRGADQEMSLETFNARLAWDMPNAMLQRNR